MHAKGSVRWRDIPEISTTTLLVSFFVTASNGLDSFSFLISDWAPGAASPNPVTNTDTLSDFSDGLATAASARNANNTSAITHSLSPLFFPCTPAHALPAVLLRDARPIVASEG